MWVGLVVGVVSCAAPPERSVVPPRIPAQADVPPRIPAQADAAAVRSSLVEAKLRAAGDTSTVTARLDATLWLFEHEPERLLMELREDPERVDLRTGEYIRARRPGEPPHPVCITPGLRGLNSADSEAWDAACLERDGVALMTGELMAEAVRRTDGSVIGYLARTLRLHSREGVRRAAFCWLVAHAGLPADYDWRSLTREQEELGPRAANRRTLPADHPAVVRDRWLQTWAATVDSVLTADDGRQALIALVEERDYVPLTLSLPALQRGDEGREGRFVVLGGRWRCDLEAKTFVVAFDSPWSFHEVSGVFERDPSTRAWRTRIVSERWGHFR